MTKTIVGIKQFIIYVAFQISSHDRQSTAFRYASFIALESTVATNSAPKEPTVETRLAARVLCPPHSHSLRPKSMEQSHSSRCHHTTSATRLKYTKHGVTPVSPQHYPQHHLYQTHVSFQDYIFSKKHTQSLTHTLTKARINITLPPSIHLSSCLYKPMII